MALYTSQLGGGNIVPYTSHTLLATIIGNSNGDFSKNMGSDDYLLSYRAIAIDLSDNSSSNPHWFWGSLNGIDPQLTHYIIEHFNINRLYLYVAHLEGNGKYFSVETNNASRFANITGKLYGFN